MECFVFSCINCCFTSFWINYHHKYTRKHQNTLHTFKMKTYLSSKFLTHPLDINKNSKFWWCHSKKYICFGKIYFENPSSVKFCFPQGASARRIYWRNYRISFYLNVISLIFYIYCVFLKIYLAFVFYSFLYFSMIYILQFLL